MRDIKAVLFDKDGTLFDFHATWGSWTRGLLIELAGGDMAHARRLGEAVGYDLDTEEFAPDSPIIFATPTEIAEELLPHLPGVALAPLVAQMNARAAEARPAEAVPLQPFLAGLKARGLYLGVATNDGEAPARAHLASSGVADLFDFVAGFDSGHGGKPAPGQLLAFAAHHGIDPGQVVMVGDSCHDLVAGRAAGMHTVAVLTGVAKHAELAPFADAVLPDIGHLPAWLSAPG